MTTSTKLDQVTRQMPLEHVNFYDGMIITAEDLEAERTYHLARSRMINRAVFGCGIACGLEVEKDPDAAGGKTRFVCVRPGVAIDCRGDPIELCRPVKLDLDPDPCKQPPRDVCIVIRRLEPRPGSGRDCCGGENRSSPPRRVREEVEVRVLWPVPPGVCGHLDRTEKQNENGGNGGEVVEQGEDEGEAETLSETLSKICDCLTACESCDECGEGWILLACVNVGPPDNSAGHDRQSDRWVIGKIDQSGRKYIKPIDCLCRLSEVKKPPRGKKPDDETRQPEGEAEGGTDSNEGQVE